MASLRETQGRVVERTKQVHARAHEIVDEHEGYEKIPAVAEGLELERRRQRLREMLASALDNADVQVQLKNSHNTTIPRIDVLI